MLKRTTTAALLATLTATGCAGSGRPAADPLPPRAAAALRDAEQFDLLSLDPRRTDTAAGERFHGWRVLGRTTVTDAATRDKLATALRRGARENTTTAAGCFNPRHAIHTTHGAHAVDLVICFECLSVAVYEGDERSASFLVSRSPQPAFDAVLRKSGVPLATKP